MPVKVVLGVLMLLAAAFCGFIAVQSFGDGMFETSRQIGVQLALTGVWLAWAGLLIARKAPAARLRWPGIAAILAGVVGFVTFLPLSVGNGEWQREIDHRLTPKAFLCWALFAALAGLGHWLHGRAKWLYVLAVAALLAGVYFVVNRPQ